jgi:putative FmdB family regulatory protein
MSPIYEFRCPKCQTEKEVLLFGENVKAIWCDHCGGTMEKIMSPPAIVYEMMRANDAQR